MREHVAKGPVESPKPMNPQSVVFPDHNPNVIRIRSGAFQGPGVRRG